MKTRLHEILLNLARTYSSHAARYEEMASRLETERQENIAAEALRLVAKQQERRADRMTDLAGELQAHGDVGRTLAELERQVKEGAAHDEDIARLVRAVTGQSPE